MLENDNDAEPLYTITIRSAEDAWEWFSRASDPNSYIPDNPVLKFEGWPSFEVAFNGKDWHGSVPSRVMSPLLEIQRDLHRSYANLCYGMPNLRKLKDEDREQLEIVVQVEKGSSQYKAPFDTQLTKLARDALKNMDSRHKMIMVLGIALVWGATDINKAWVAQRQDETQAEKTVELSHEETERLKVFAAATKQVPALKDVKHDYEASQNRLLKTVKPGDSVRSSGVHLSGPEAIAITHEETARSEEIRISGAFRVLSNNTTNGAGFRIKVSRVSDGMTFSADVPLALPDEDKNMIQRAEWSKGAVAVNLDLTASMLRGKVINAVVTGAAIDP